MRQDDTRRDVSNQLRNRSQWTSHSCKPCFHLHLHLFSEASAVGSILSTTNTQTSRQVRSILVDPTSVRPGLNQTKSNSNHFVSTNQPWLFNLKHLQHPLFSCNFGNSTSSSLTLLPNSNQVALTQLYTFLPFLIQGEPLYHLTTPTTITTITRQKRTDTSLTQETIQFLCLCPTWVLWCLLYQLFLTDSI